VGLVVLFIGFWKLNYHDLHVRYRLTVEVQDGDQIKTGSSVIDAAYRIDPGWIWEGPHDYDPDIVGYAPTVDLGKEGMLFLTFEKTRTSFYEREGYKQIPFGFGVIGCLPFAAYDKSGLRNNPTEVKASLDELLRQSGPRDVPFAMLPKFARFLDINDPLTLAPVALEDFATKIGSGVQLKRVVLQLTRDPVTPAPEVWPQWLKEKRPSYEGKLRGWHNE
jgi:hypothetical protein